ncbi:MAG: GerMN domain-containing protein [Chloroflexi bacterium]|nr:GerMN domain-containing protein [Chloroflexota bacterium]
MSRVWAIALTLTLVLTACGAGGAAPERSNLSGPPAAASSVAPGATTSAASGTPPSVPPSGSSPSAAVQTVQVYFTSGVKLVTESAQVSGPDVARQAIERLLAGPATTGDYSEVPAGTRLQSLNLANGVASVSFDAGFYQAAGATGSQQRLAQVVYTLTQFPTITSVRFLSDGNAVGMLGGEGFPMDRPLTRGSFPSVQA